MYHGFELEREYEALEEFPPELEEQIRAALADSLARGEARHAALKRHRPHIEEIREAYRRSGGATPRLGVAELAPLYERALADVHSMTDFRAAPLAIDFDRIVPAGERARLLALPDTVVIRGREVPIDYDVENADGRPRGVARLRLPEKLARTLTEDELPALDRPLRFTVLRGPRGAVRASTLDELQEILARPWSPDEIALDERPADLTPREERRTRELAREFRRNQRGRGERFGAPGDDRDRARRSSGRGPRPPGRGAGRRRRGR
jgi:hypothetical protein